MFMKNYVRNIFIFVVTFSLVFALSIIPSYAVNGQLVDVPVSTNPTNDGFYLGKYNNKDIKVSAAQSNVKVCIVYDTPYAISLSPFTSYWLNDDGQNVSRNGISYTYNGDTVVYVNAPNFINSDMQLTPYNSINEAIEELINPPITGTPYNAYFDIPCGNVAYIKTGNDNTLTLSCNMPEYSKLTGNTGSYWTNTMQIAYGIPTYPPTGTTYPLSSMSSIQWFRSTEGRDLLGRTKKALFLDTTHGTDNFIVIYNPTYRELTTSGQGDINPTIRVQCSKLIDYHIYSLTGEYNSNGTISSYSIDGFSDPFIGTPTSDNEEVTGTNSSGATPVTGGTGNEIGGDGGIIQYIQGIQKTLDTFSNSFISLMKVPISHIQSLIAAGTDYFNMIRGLYGWLPDEVQGTINSAMIVSISVGVIALLL